MSDQEPDPGVPLTPPGPESEPGAEDTEVFASAEFATGPGERADEGGPKVEQTAASGDAQGTSIPGNAYGNPPAGSGSIPGYGSGSGQAAGYGQAVGYGQAPGYGYGAAGFAPQQAPEQPAKKGHRAGWIIGLGLGYAVLAGGTAFGVIADKSPAAVDVTAVNASAYAAPLGTAGGTATTGAKPKSSASASANAAASTAAPTTAPPTTATPTSTVTGTVSDGVHHGDLRFFLLPPPQGPSSVQGDPDGTTQSLDDVVSGYTDASTVRESLNQLGFKAACERTYQDSTMGANVTIQLMQFGSSGSASDWLSSFSYSGDGYQSISVSGESGAEGWSYAKDGNYDLIGVYRDGDTFFQVEVFGTQAIPAQDLGQVIKAEHSRLANG